MSMQPYSIYIERCDDRFNMARYYAMEIAPNLFGRICLTRVWGRIGTNGRISRHDFDDEGEAVRLFLLILYQKKRRGYRPRPRS